MPGARRGSSAKTSKKKGKGTRNGAVVFDAGEQLDSPVTWFVKTVQGQNNELLKHEEELSLSTQVQRMLTLRQAASELEATLGRPAEHAELAGALGEQGTLDEAAAAAKAAEGAEGRVGVLAAAAAAAMTTTRVSSAVSAATTTAAARGEAPDF